MKPYMKPGLQWEDPLDGKGPGKHRGQKKGPRLLGKRAVQCIIDELEMPDEAPAEEKS